MNNIPTNLSVASMLPNDPKVWVKSKTQLVSLGTANNLAYIYYDTMRVICADEKEIYEWREEKTVGETGGLVATSFTYPPGLIVNGVDYSNRIFNFFRVLLPEDVQENLDNIATNLASYEVANVGAGNGLYKDTTNPSALVNRFNFKSVKLENAEATGTSIIQGITPSADELSFKMKTLDSETLIFDSSVPGKLKINMPSTSSLLDFYVRCDATVTYFDWLAANASANGGIPVIGYQYKGFGTIAKPFVDTRVYTLGSPDIPADVTPNTAVETAKIAYIGLGTIFSPQHDGKRIRIQAASVQHIFTDNFNINGVVVRVETGGSLYSAPIESTGEDSWLVNLDHSGIGVDTIMGVTFEIEEGGLLTVSKNGFKNKGTSLGTFNFAISKQVVIRNQGIIYQDRTIEAGDTPGDYIMFDMNAAATGAGSGTYKNDGNALVGVTGGKIHSKINPIFKGGIHVSDFTEVQFNYGSIGIDINPDIIPFDSVTALYTRMEKCTFYNLGNQTPKTIFRLTGDNPSILLIEPLINGTVESLVTIDPHASNPDLDGIFTMYNGTNKDGFVATVTLFKKTGVRVAKWKKVYFNNNYITRGDIDETKIDMTNGNYQGVVNFIGRPIDDNKQITYHLPRFGSRLAAMGGVPLVYSLMQPGTLFMNTNGAAIDSTPNSSWFMDIVI